MKKLLHDCRRREEKMKTFTKKRGTCAMCQECEAAEDGERDFALCRVFA